MLNRKKLKKISYWAGGGFFALLILSAASIQYTSQSSFCKTCHYMKPFYESWKESSHSDIKCIDCHYPPGIKHKLRGKVEGLVQVVNYVSHAYRKSKPWAEIPDESCLRPGCHDTQLLDGQEEFKNVAFAHKPHLTELRRDKKIRCTSCHSQIVQGSHIRVTESTCFICHFKPNTVDYEKTGDCKLCHTDDKMQQLSTEEKIKFDHTAVVKQGMDCQQCHSQTVSGNGVVLREQCFSCHWENERLAKFNNTDFLHKTHITDRKVECFQCHSPIQHEIGHQDIESLADCQTCHIGTHGSQKKLFAGVGGIDVEDMPNSMLESGLNCRGCHIFHALNGRSASQESTYVAKPQACEKCHGEGFGNLMQQWEKTSNKKIRRLEQFFVSAEKEINRLRKKNAAKDFMDAARFNINLVKRGKSVHNISYADALLNAAYNKLVQGLDIAGSSYKLPVFGAASTVIPSECVSCHVSLQVEEVPVFGIAFSHERHVLDNNVECKKCHSNARKHGDLILTRDQCLNCHHQEQEKKECNDCHEVAVSFYNGTTSLAGSPSPDIMFEADLDCYSCHAGDGGEKIIRTTGAQCVDCHEEGYDDMLAEWQSSVKEILSEIDVLRNNIDRSALSDSQKKILNEVNAIVNVVKLDGSFGAHNYDLIEEMLTSAKAKIEQL